MFSIKKLKLLIEFYKSTLLFSFSFFLFLRVLPLIFPSGFAIGTTTAFFNGSFIGLLLFLILKETSKYKDYLFYINCGVSKVQLFGFSFFVNLIITLILKYILE